MSTNQQPTKEIKWDKLTRDYTLIYDGREIGSAPTYQEAQARLDEHAYRTLRGALLFEFLVKQEEARS